MSHTYAIVRLLEHGALPFTEMREITGWTCNQLKSALGRLMERDAVTCEKSGRLNVYRLP